MEGFGVHTFRLINKEGRETFVKFHWKPTCGVKSLMDDEAVVVGGKNHSHATKDLYDSIEKGTFPEWKLYIQTMSSEDQHKFDFDPVDVTKTWPEDKFPLKEVGRMVLNRNVDNFFAENEQLAFCPANIVPGVAYTDDKMFQTRIFSYLDTQRHRLGNPYLLPVNAPRCQYHMQHIEGVGNVAQRHSEVNYFPSEHVKVHEAPKYPIPSDTISGRRERKNIDKENNFCQAGARWRSFDAARRERFISRVADTLNSPRVTVELKRIWLHYWSQCDKQLGEQLAKKVRLTAAQ
jgi:catalase